MPALAHSVSNAAACASGISCSLLTPSGGGLSEYARVSLFSQDYAEVFYFLSIILAPAGVCCWVCLLALLALLRRFGVVESNTADAMLSALIILLAVILVL